MINHTLLIFKNYVCKTRENGSLDLRVLKRNIHKIKNIEIQRSLNKPEKRKNFEETRTYFEIYRGATVGVGEG